MMHSQASGQDRALKAVSLNTQVCDYRIKYRDSGLESLNSVVQSGLPENKENCLEDSHYTLKKELSHSPPRLLKSAIRRAGSSPDNQELPTPQMAFLNFHNVQVSREDFRSLASNDPRRRLFFKFKVYRTRIERWQIDEFGNEVEGGLREIIDGDSPVSSQLPQQPQPDEYALPPGVRYLGSRLIPLPLPRESQEKLAQALKSHLNQETTYQQLLAQQRDIYDQLFSSTQAAGNQPPAQNEWQGHEVYAMQPAARGFDSMYGQETCLNFAKKPEALAQRINTYSSKLDSFTSQLADDYNNHQSVIEYRGSDMQGIREHLDMHERPFQQMHELGSPVDGPFNIRHLPELTRTAETGHLQLGFVPQITVDPLDKPLNIFESCMPVLALEQTGQQVVLLSKDFNDWIERGVFKQILTAEDISKRYAADPRGGLSLIDEVPEDKSECSPTKQRERYPMMRADSRGYIVTQLQSPAKVSAVQNTANKSSGPTPDAGVETRPYLLEKSSHSPQRSNSRHLSDRKASQKESLKQAPAPLDSSQQIRPLPVFAADGAGDASMKILGSTFLFLPNSPAPQSTRPLDCCIDEPCAANEQEAVGDKRVKEISLMSSLDIQPNKINTASNGSEQKQAQYPDLLARSHLPYPTLLCSSTKKDRSIQVRTSIQPEPAATGLKFECNNFIVLEPKQHRTSLNAFMIEAIQIEGRKKSACQSESVQTDLLSPYIANQVIREVMKSSEFATQNLGGDQPFTVTVSQEHGTDNFLINVEVGDDAPEEDLTRLHEDCSMHHKKAPTDLFARDPLERKQTLGIYTIEQESEGKECDAEVTLEKPEDDSPVDDEGLNDGKRNQRFYGSIDNKRLQGASPSGVDLRRITHSQNNPLLNINEFREEEALNNSRSTTEIKSLPNGEFGGHFGGFRHDTNEEQDPFRDSKQHNLQVRRETTSEVSNSRTEYMPCGSASLQASEQKPDKQRTLTAPGSNQNSRHDILNIIHEENHLGQDFSASQAENQALLLDEKKSLSKSKSSICSNGANLKILTPELEEIVSRSKKRGDTSDSKSLKSLLALPIEPQVHTQLQETAKFTIEATEGLQGSGKGTTVKKDKTDPKRDKSKSISKVKDSKSNKASCDLTDSSNLKPQGARDKTPDLRRTQHTASNQNERKTPKSKSPMPTKSTPAPQDKELKSVSMIKKHIEESAPTYDKPKQLDTSKNSFSPITTQTQKRSATPNNRAGRSKSPIGTRADFPSTHKNTIQTLFQDQIGGSHRRRAEPSRGVVEEPTQVTAKNKQHMKTDTSLTHFNQASDSETNSVASSQVKEHHMRNKSFVEKHFDSKHMKAAEPGHPEGLRSHRSTKSYLPSNPAKAENVFESREGKPAGVRGHGNLGSSSKTVQHPPSKAPLATSAPKPKNPTKMQKSGSFSKHSQGKMSAQTFGVPDSRLNSRQASLTRKNSESHHGDSLTAESLLRDRILNEFIASLCSTGILNEEDCANEKFFIENEAIMIGFEGMVALCGEMGFLPEDYDPETDKFHSYDELLSAMWFILGGEQAEAICIQDLSVFILAIFGLGLNCIVEDGAEEDMFNDEEVCEIQTAFRLFFDTKAFRDELKHQHQQSSGFKKTVIEIVEDTDRNPPYEPYHDHMIEEATEEEDPEEKGYYYHSNDFQDNPRAPRMTAKSRNPDASFVSRNQPPKSIYSTTSSPMLLLDVNLGGGKVERVMMHEGDDPCEIADRIIRENSKLC